MVFTFFDSRFISSAVISFSAVILYYNLIKRKKNKTPKTRVIFFTKKLTNCRNVCFSNKIPCNADCSIMKIQILINVFESAESTLDACIFLITNYSIANAIIRAQKRGVNVRIIYDENMAFSTESKISWFTNEGLSVKSNCNDLSRNMHHKFCIVDSATENRKLLTGSVNWTMQGVAGNYEHCTITSRLTPVQNYQEMFNNLWEIFETKK